MNTQHDCRTWDENGRPYPVDLQPKPTPFYDMFLSVVEMLGIGLLLVCIVYGCSSCNQEAQAAEPEDCAMLIPVMVAIEWSRYVNPDPNFFFGADKRGRPISPISHKRDGSLKVGTGNSFGD